MLPTAWLVPNHYQPWASAWLDGLAMLLLALHLSLVNSERKLPAIGLLLCSIALAAVGLQAAGGLIGFSGDAWVVAMYIGVFGLAIVAGMAAHSRPGATDATVMLDAFALGVVAAAILSTGIALAQWTGAVSLGIWQVDLPPRGRPFANVAQPNHFCTIAFLGLCSAGFLRTRRILSAPSFWLVAALLLVGMVMSGSRTGWVQIAMLVVLVTLFSPRGARMLKRAEGGLLALLFATLVLAWPAINRWLLLAEGRDLTESMRVGTRGAHWRAMVDAIGQSPWVGYGWNQVGAAQMQVADRHPPVGEHIEHAHNLFLDLLLWNGIPVGGLLCGLLLWWAGSRLWRSRGHALSMWMMASIGGLGAHAMLEYPLDYAYFLIPLGLWIGAVEARLPATRAWRVPAWSVRASGVVLLGGLLVLGRDYLKAEEGHRLLRLESARIGVSGITTPPPQLLLLTQLQAFQTFAQTEARADMKPGEIDWMRKVAERFAYPPVLFRYALALGLNGRADRAALTLKGLCHIHPRERCVEARDGWLQAQTRYPVLAAVPVPSLSDAVSVPGSVPPSALARP